MNKVRFFVTLITALLVTGTFVFAHEGEEHHKMKIKLGHDMEAIEIEDMEVGETRQFFTDEGKEIVVTREEHGYELSVDGKQIDIVSAGDHHGASVISVGGDDGEHVNVFVKKMVMSDDEGDPGVFVVSGDDIGEDFVWTTDTGEHAGVSVFVQKKDVLSHVLESGVLDQLDSATRGEIIRVIEEAEGDEAHRVIRKKKIVRKDD